MFDTVFGLPLHPLVVHAVVVLVPLSALLVIALAVVPRWRATAFGWFVVGLTTVATLAVPVASQSGEALSERVGEPERHASLGEALIYFMLPLLVLTVAMVVLAQRRRRATPAPTDPAAPVAHSPAGPATPVLSTVVAVAAALVAAGALVQVAFIGHSGAEATWSDVAASGEGG